MKLYRKIMVLAIIGLFIGAGIVPSISSKIGEVNNVSYIVKELSHEDENFDFEAGNEDDIFNSPVLNQCGCDKDTSDVDELNKRNSLEYGDADGKVSNDHLQEIRDVIEENDAQWTASYMSVSDLPESEMQSRLVPIEKLEEGLDKEKAVTSLDQLDQYQTNYCGYAYGTCGGGMFAQSFVPSLDTLTRVQLFMCKDGNPSRLKISIRSSIYGSDLTSVTKYASSISESEQWVEFDFSDISVTPGQTYYIVWDPTAYDEDNCFYWFFDYNNPYVKGDSWFYDGYSWTILFDSDFPNIDFCFKTYGESGGTSTDYVVIVCGGTGDKLQDEFERTTDHAYQTFKRLGYTDETIYYLSSGTYYSTGVDAYTTKNNVKYAITSWLATHTGHNNNCFILFVDHGDDGGYFFVGSVYDYIRDYELAGWINDVHHYKTMTILIDSCYAGDFINDLSQSDRIIMTATDGSNFGYCYSGGEMIFSNGFLNKLVTGASYGKAWENGDRAVEAISHNLKNSEYVRMTAGFSKGFPSSLHKFSTLENSDEKNPGNIAIQTLSHIYSIYSEFHAFPKTSFKNFLSKLPKLQDDQNPLIDDNGDDIGHGTSYADTLPLNGDGYLALSTYP